jgi:hypothetical protein
MEGGIQQQWKEGSNNEEFNNDGRRGGSHNETEVKMANKGRSH